MPHFIPSCLARYFNEIIVKKHFQKMCAFGTCCLLLLSGGNTLQNIPGFDNTFTPSAGTDGLRLNIHEPGTVPNPSFQVWHYILVKFSLIQLFYTVAHCFKLLQTNFGCFTLLRLCKGGGSSAPHSLQDLALCSPLPKFSLSMLPKLTLCAP